MIVPSQEVEDVNLEAAHKELPSGVMLNYLHVAMVNNRRIKNKLQHRRFQLAEVTSYVFTSRKDGSDGSWVGFFMLALSCALCTILNFNVARMTQTASSSFGIFPSYRPNHI